MMNKWNPKNAKGESCPKQSESLNTNPFRVNHITLLKILFIFFQDEINKQRLILAMRLLSHPQNFFQRVRK